MLSPKWARIAIGPRPRRAAKTVSTPHPSDVRFNAAGTIGIAARKATLVARSDPTHAVATQTIGNAVRQDTLGRRSDRTDAAATQTVGNTTRRAVPVARRSRTHVVAIETIGIAVNRAAAMRSGRTRSAVTIATIGSVGRSADLVLSHTRNAAMIVMTGSAARKVAVVVRGSRTRSVAVIAMIDRLDKNVEAGRKSRAIDPRAVAAMAMNERDAGNVPRSEMKTVDLLRRNAIEAVSLSRGVVAVAGKGTNGFPIQTANSERGWTCAI